MRYKEYKKTDIPWLDEVPSHWEIVRNKNLFKHKKNIIGNESESAQLLSLTTKGIKKINIEDSKGKTPMSYDTYQKVFKDDLVLCLFDLDVSAVFSDASKYYGMISPAYQVFESDIVHMNYYKYIFDKIFQDRSYKLHSKSLRYTITPDNFLMLDMIVPPKKEQEQIARFLDWKINEIDRLILLKNAKVKKLDKNIQLLIDEGIASIKNYKEIKLKNLGTFLKNGNLSRNDEEKNSKFSALLYGDIYTKYYYIFDEAQTKINKQSYYDNPIINGNTLFFTTSGETREEIGKCVLYTGCEKIAVGGDLVVFKEFDTVDSKYLTYALNTSDAINYRYVNARGEIIIHISQASLGNYKIRVPQMSIQEEISTKIEENIRNNNEIREKVEKQINNLQQLKKSLISEVVTGKMDVRNVVIPEYDKVSDIEDDIILDGNFNEEV